MNLDEIKKEKWMLVARVQYLHDHVDEGELTDWIKELTKCNNRYLELLEEQSRLLAQESTTTSSSSEC
jgi:hypothetical protein